MMETEGGRVDIGDDVARSKEADDDDEASEAESTMRATTAHRLPTTHTQTHKRVSTTRFEFKLEIDRERARERPFVLHARSQPSKPNPPPPLALSRLSGCLAVCLSANHVGRSRWAVSRSSRSTTDQEREPPPHQRVAAAASTTERPNKREITRKRENTRRALASVTQSRAPMMTLIFECKALVALTIALIYPCTQ